jgi:hypothetical protein
MALNITAEIDIGSGVVDEVADNLGLPVPEFNILLIDLTPFEAAIVYGLAGLVLSVGPGALWRWFFRENPLFSTVGYKFLCYAQFWIWGAVFASWLLAILLPSQSV